MTPGLCDAHNHLQEERFASQLPAVLDALPAAGITPEELRALTNNNFSCFFTPCPVNP